MPIPLVFDLEDSYFNLEHYIDNRDKKYPTTADGDLLIASKCTNAY